MLGSAQDAEDALQETLVAAWRGLERFEGRGSLRSWLYQIATNRCLNALRAESRRPPRYELAELPPWLEPYPDVLIEGVLDSVPGPAARYERKETLELAFVAALQHLPPRQRSVLVLCDVLGFRAAEAGPLLDMSEMAVASALKRARTSLDDRLPAIRRERVPVPDSRAERELIGRLAQAFEAGDTDAVVELIADDAWFAMPPEPLVQRGRDAIAAFLQDRFARRGGRRYRLVPTRANTQPAFGLYAGDERSPLWRAHGLLVVGLEDDRVTSLVRFCDNSVLPRFGLPRSLR